jgi:hypothetical protein
MRETEHPPDINRLPDIDWNSCPEHLIGSFQRYFWWGIDPGSFLSAVLANDLMQTMNRADDRNRRMLFKICCFVYTQLPSDCHGDWQYFNDWSKERYELFVERQRDISPEEDRIR